MVNEFRSGMKLTLLLPYLVIVFAIFNGTDQSSIQEKSNEVKIMFDSNKFNMFNKYIGIESLVSH